MNSNNNKNYIGRLAPSPTGALHLGNIRTFMVAYLRARSLGGRLILRIEDLAHPKHKDGFTASLIDDLRFLGFEWDEGPDISTEEKRYIQSGRMELYERALNVLLDEGLLYKCTCSRRDIENAQSAPHEGEILRYPGTCFGLREATGELSLDELEEGAALRLITSDCPEVEIFDRLHGRYSLVVNDVHGDFVVYRKGAGPAYNLAVVVDDFLMGVTEVVRGDDLLSSAPLQKLLALKLGFDVPEYLHVPIVVGPDGRRLAKRHGDSRISYYRSNGVRGRQIIGLLANSLGLVPEVGDYSLDELVPLFDLGKISEERCVLPATDLSLFGG